MKTKIISYKPPGSTPLELINNIRTQYPEYRAAKITYAGRLDPMAEGLMILLVDEAIKKKEAFLKLRKSYEMQVLIGATTDTLDCLGMVSKYSHHSIESTSVQYIQNILDSWVGPYKQPYPSYSSKPVAGKPLWLHAREGSLAGIDIPTKEVQIIQAACVSVTRIQMSDLKKVATEKIKRVSGDFRQTACIESWSQLKGSHQYPIYTLKITASSGTYMRQLANRLGDELGQPALAFHIRRTAIGDHALSNYELPYGPILRTHSVAK